MIALSVTSPSTKSTNLLAVGASVPIGQRGIVTVWGRNDLSVAQQMGIEWEVRDPDGIVVEHYGPAWEMWPYAGPGDEHKFDGGRFDLDKVGTYTLKVDLLMNQDSPVVVDSYQGDLCITTTEIPPEYELLEETIYPYAYIYDGPHDGGIFTFSTDPFIPASWIAGRLAAACEDEVRKAGGRMLEMRVYVDRSPLLWSNWRIEVVTAPPGTGVGVAMPLGIAWWAVALLLALVIALFIIITWAAKEIAGLFKRKPELEEVKVAWGKETLIKTIQDAEEYWERPLTPVETLEDMSEGELRDNLDKIAEEEVLPEEISPWAIVALVGVLGLGAAAIALATARPKE